MGRRAGAIIGGTAVNQGNVIGGNHGNGIETLDGAGGIQVYGNFIGTDATGEMLDLANRENGIQLASSSNMIGGSDGGDGNTIDFNGSGQVGSGVQLVGSANQNAILSNSIYDEFRAGDQSGRRADAQSRPWYARAQRLSELPDLDVSS